MPPALNSAAVRPDGAARTDAVTRPDGAVRSDGAARRDGVIRGVPDSLPDEPPPAPPVTVTTTVAPTSYAMPGHPTPDNIGQALHRQRSAGAVPLPGTAEMGFSTRYIVDAPAGTGRTVQ